MVAGALARLAWFAFAAYLVLLLGANSQAISGGPLAWWPVWQLPASGGELAGIGVISLLPPLSAACWLLARARAGRLRALAWRPDRLSWPLLALAALGALSLARQCGGGCPVGDGLRLALLLAHLAWVYLYVVNERPPLFGIIAVALLLQSTVALGQFVLQRDLGLRFLGEPALDPAAPGITGISVVIRDGQRWLRAYGLTAHPNVLAGSLVALLLMIPALGRQPTAGRRALVVLLFAVGFAALFATLARWAAVCFVLGLAVNAWPALRATWQRRPVVAPIGRGVWLALLLTGVLLFAVYGNAVVGRAVALETPVENRSLWERGRDTRLAWRLAAENPLTGVGLGQFRAVARRYDAWAEVVHNVPLWLAAEVGVAGALVWVWLLLAPVARRGALTRYAPLTGLWLGFWLLGLFQTAPHPLIDLRSALLTGLALGLVTASKRWDADDGDWAYRRG